MTSSIFLPSTPPASLISFAFTLAPLRAGASTEERAPVTLNGAPILMVSSAAAGRDENVPEAITRPADAADLNTVLLVSFMGSFLSAFVKQCGNSSERQLEIAHNAARTEDHDQDEDDPEDDLARPVEGRNDDETDVKPAFQVAQQLAEHRDDDHAQHGAGHASHAADHQHADQREGIGKIETGGRERAEVVAVQRAADPGKEGPDDEGRQPGGQHVHADRLGRDQVLAHGT